MIGRPSRRDRLGRWLAGMALLGVVLVVNLPTVTSFAERTLHDIEINSQGYKEHNGHWSVLSVPSRFRINAVHAALLDTGKVLIVAGSGNSLGYFNAGTFKSIIWDPQTNKFKLIHTPSDMFCGGHAFLPDGKLLIAGGTKRYEVLAKQVTSASGVMLIQNNATTGKPDRLPAGTEFIAPSGQAYRSTMAATVAPARMVRQPGGASALVAGSDEVWVEAVTKGRTAIIETSTRFTVAGATASTGLVGVSASLTMSQQDFWASEKSYLFNPATESYEKVSNLNIARWYPTLVGLKDGRVLAVSGLDQFGRIVQGQTEIYSPSTRAWKLDPALTRVLPTYPALFLLSSGNLFFSGSNAGYGSATIGRTPGIWNLRNNSFRVVPGLKDPTETETSGSVLLPPAQAQKYMIIGGGGIGESPESTSRTAIADLNSREPHYQPGPSLAQPTRYPNVVITPDNKIIITGGSKEYRGKHESDLFECHVYDPATNKLTSLAEPTVGRNYHSEALLLPDGRIVTLGGNPLYGNKEDTSPGFFEQRIEIYSPPYLYHGKRPEITGGPREVARGSTVVFQTPDPNDIQTASLLRPAAVTHVTDVEQRSIALKVTTLALGKRRGAVIVTIPQGSGLIPAGWYMLFVTNRQATPSVARWVHVS